MKSAAFCTKRSLRHGSPLKLVVSVRPRQSSTSGASAGLINGGVRGFATDVEGTASGNTATSNAEIGIVVRDGTVSGNTSNFNGFVGILVSCPGSVVDNTAIGNGSTNLFTQNPGCVLANNAAP